MISDRKLYVTMQIEFLISYKWLCIKTLWRSCSYCVVNLQLIQS